MPDTQPPNIAWYNNRAAQIADQYEQLSFDQVHGWLRDYLPSGGGALVLDIGAGSGRDAAWLAEQGHDVVAVEPAAELRQEAQRRHPDERISWLGDSLPDLAAVHRLGTSFDVILLSAVWMHVPPNERSRAFRKLVTLLKPGGVLAITLRLGEPDTERGMHAVSIEELHQLAREHGAYIEHGNQSSDALGRAGVSWAEVAIRLHEEQFSE
ncbi:methyltransferase domain-containing protein [Halorhodospira halochloris]|uniref:class I SAM-dependent methyltransferase n=1 Tax=Halorhodospira halochloris TaxID=1052 RepID=UPI001EE96A9E|nr:class I SAM-dependent methyltransferase [Halorhodospira halochloris]MCG5531564.1 methyltransferase domain-containing protein [Halorhodospira halochloris]